MENWVCQDSIAPCKTCAVISIMAKQRRNLRLSSLGSSSRGLGPSKWSELTIYFWTESRVGQNTVTVLST